MREKAAESHIYGDLEKFYRVLAYYDGQEIKPLEAHERHSDVNLEKFLRDPESYIRRIQYQIAMSESLCEGYPVYKTDKPETSLVYALFSEGIESLILLR